MGPNRYRSNDSTPPEPTNSRGEYVGGLNPPSPGDERPRSKDAPRQRSSYDSYTSYGPSRHPKRDPNDGEY